MRALSFAALAALSIWHAPVAAQQYDLRVFGVEDGLPGSTVEAIAQDSSGFLWIGTDRGLCRYDGRAFRSWPLSDPPPTMPGARVLADSAAAIWRLHVDSWQNRLRVEGEWWMATPHGVEVKSADEEPGRVLGRHNGLGTDDVRCLFHDASGVVWIGCAKGGLTRYTGDAVTWVDERYGLLDPSIAAIRSGDSGAVMIRDVEGIELAYRWPERFCKLVYRGEELPAASIELKDGTQWQSADQGLLATLPDGQTIHVGRDTLRVNALGAFGDSVLIGTEQGLYMAPMDNSAAHWAPVITLSGEAITAMVVDRAKNVWLGTRDAGVLRYRPGRTERWTTREHLASDHVRSLLLDAVQDVWVGTDRGFSWLQLDEAQEEVINVRSFGRADGFPAIEAMPNACVLAPDSALWFGTPRGAVRFDPRRVFEDPIAPRTRITDIRLFFERPDWSPWSSGPDANGWPINLRLPHDRDHLTFSYTGLSLAYPEQVRFQTMLQGRDVDWSPITAEDHVTYSGLTPGDYVFLVKARNGSGIWNDEPARFAFTIAPPFWSTWWFRVCAIGAVLVGFFALQRLRDRRARRAREHLERMVEDRTRELSEEKHRSDSLLLNILPEITAAELKENGSAQARSYAACTVLFSDFQGFTVLSELLEATGIVTELDRFFRAFDRITDTYGTEKIKTIGDAYMCAAGVPHPSPTHALDAVLMALEMLEVVDRINAARLQEGHPAWPIRIGLHSGPLIAGVVGEKKFAYDVWGDTVNLASRMESSGAPGRVHVTRSVIELVDAYVVSEARGVVSLKGKGDVQSWFIDRLKPAYSADTAGRKANEVLLAERVRLRDQRPAVDTL